MKNTPNFYGVASLRKFNKDTTPISLIQTFLVELEKVFDLLNEGQIKKIIKEWTKKSSTIGKNVELATKEGKISGKATKIDDDGALVIAGKKNTRVIAGDIIHLPK